jgi:hypothetical protein
VRSGSRNLAALRFGFLRAANIPTSMYGNYQSVKKDLTPAQQHENPSCGPSH